MNNEIINLAFLDASDGPRVVLFGASNEAVVAICNLFEELSDGNGPFQIETLPFVNAVDDVKLRASQGSLQGIRRNHPGLPAEFTWERTAAGWEYLSELLRGLANSSVPGHQYLTAYPNEDAIVVVSKGEFALSDGGQVTVLA